MNTLWWRLVRFGFRLLYNEMAWTYDLVSWSVSLGRWRSWQRAAITHFDAPPGSLILELAHGTGDLQLDLLAAGYRTVGYDLSPYMGRIARRKHLRAGHTPQLVRGLAQHLPFPDASFDAIVSTFPTEFIIAPESLSEAWRVLRPGGRLVVIPNAQLKPSGLLVRWIERLYVTTGQRQAWPVNLESVCAEAGFDPATLFEQDLPDSSVQILIAQKPPLR